MTPYTGAASNNFEVMGALSGFSVMAVIAAML